MLLVSAANFGIELRRFRICACASIRFQRECTPVNSHLKTYTDTHIAASRPSYIVFLTFLAIMLEL